MLAAKIGTKRIGEYGPKFRPKAAPTTPNPIASKTGTNSQATNIRERAVSDLIDAMIKPPSAARATNPARYVGTHE